MNTGDPEAPPLVSGPVTGGRIGSPTKLTKLDDPDDPGFPTGFREVCATLLRRCLVFDHEPIPWGDERRRSRYSDHV
jgi:hypothetical protein